MKYYSFLLGALVLFFGGALQGETVCCDNGIEARVDFLWWKPLVDELTYAVDVNQTSSHADVSFLQICPSWSPGVRVSVEKENICSCFGIGASYTFLTSSESDSRQHANPIFFAAAPEQGSTEPPVFAKWEADYHAWDLLFSRPLNCCECDDTPCCFNFIPFIGVAGVVLDQNLKSHVQFPINNNSSQEKVDVKWDSELWGVGLKLGTDFTYCINRCLSFFAHGSATLLSGHVDQEISETVFVNNVLTNSARVKPENCCFIIPGCHIRLGFEYAKAVCGKECTMRIGYEFLEWGNIPFAGTLTESAILAKTDFGFHGLFAGAGVKF